MADLKGIYKCEICGNIVEVLHNGAGELVCCGEAMKHFVANTVDAAKEKHVPVIEITEEGVKVTIGSVAHPMEAEHYIEWIELIANGVSHRQMLKPGDEPMAFFVGINATSFTAREYCNLHGLWKSESQ